MPFLKLMALFTTKIRGGYKDDAAHDSGSALSNRSDDIKLESGERRPTLHSKRGINMEIRVSGDCGSQTHFFFFI